MAEAQYKSGQMTLPPPPELRLHHKEDKETRNVVLKTLQTPKKTRVPVADPPNKDPLDLDWDTNQDAALEHMQERRHKESRSSSVASRSSSSGKRHRSASQSRDEVNPKKGCPMPDREYVTGKILRHAGKAQHCPVSSP